jgi:diketogulonate reductase-like aldo/keto reductase
MRLDSVSEDEAVAAVRLAVESGVNVIHTSPTYGESCRRVAKGIEGLRDRVILNVKIFGSSAEMAREQLESSLEMLDTDIIDIAQFRITEDLFDGGISKEGGFGVLEEAKEAGSVGHIGITDHDPAFLARAIDLVPVSNVLCPLSYVYTDPVQELIPTAAESDIGFSAMKVLGRGVLKDVPAAIGFVLGKGAANAIIGMSTTREVEASLNALDRLPSLSPELEGRLERKRERLLERYRVSNGALVRGNRGKEMGSSCPGCGREIDEHSVFCPECGTRNPSFSGV